MVTIIFIICISATSCLAFLYGAYKGSAQTAIYYSLIHGYLKGYVSSIIEHEEFIRLYTKSVQKAQKSIKTGTIIEP